MPRKAVELSALAVNRITKPGSHPVGGVAGSLLRVSTTRARSWVLRITTGTRINAKGKTVQRRREIGLGGYPDVTLAQAREKARLKREQVEKGSTTSKSEKRPDAPCMTLRRSTSHWAKPLSNTPKSKQPSFATKSTRSSG